MFSVYTDSGTLAHSGPNGKPFENEDDAKQDAKGRNNRAREMGLTTRYEVGPGKAQLTKKEIEASAA